MVFCGQKTTFPRRSLLQVKKTSFAAMRLRVKINSTHTHTHTPSNYYFLASAWALPRPISFPNVFLPLYLPHVRKIGNNLPRITSALFILQIQFRDSCHTRTHITRCLREKYTATAGSSSVEVFPSWWMKKKILHLYSNLRSSNCMKFSLYQPIDSTV